MKFVAPQEVVVGAPRLLDSSTDSKAVFKDKLRIRPEPKGPWFTRRVGHPFP